MKRTGLTNQGGEGREREREEKNYDSIPIVEKTFEKLKEEEGNFILNKFVEIKNVDEETPIVPRTVCRSKH